MNSTWVTGIESQIMPQFHRPSGDAQRGQKQEAPYGVRSDNRIPKKKQLEGIVDRKWSHLTLLIILHRHMALKWKDNVFTLIWLLAYTLNGEEHNQSRPDCVLSHLALARYHLVAHPGDPMRLFATLNSVSAAAAKEDVVAVFFANEIGVVNFFVNNVLLHN